MKSILGIGECMIELSSEGLDLWRQRFSGDVFNSMWYAHGHPPKEEKNWFPYGYRHRSNFRSATFLRLNVNRHSTVTHYQRPTVTQLQEGGTGGEVSEILFFSAKSKRRPSLIYSMQIIPVCLSIVARRKGVSATRRRGLNWTPISLLVGHPCKLFHSLIPANSGRCFHAISARYRPIVQLKRITKWVSHF